ncbi:hypothetical protein [Acetobacter orientalis]|uniref:hypothetical protein n=1 Tax=Acetobacter orientalis TaxID=146474 RepID=UPI0039E93298
MAAPVCLVWWSLTAIAGGDVINAAISVGGFGGTGENAGTVDVTQQGLIATSGVNAAGILAQSIGGGGGTGGQANSISMVLTIEKADIPKIGKTSDDPDGLTYIKNNTGDNKSLSLSIGGSGGASGDGGATTVSNAGLIQTVGNFSDGIAAQSIGGGGGSGGKAIIGLSGVIPDEYVNDMSNLQYLSALSGMNDMTISIGGFGGAAGSGGDVSVTNTGNVSTTGIDSIGIFAQSVGGGGGDGGQGNSGSSGQLGIGGFGSSAGDGGNVSVINGSADQPSGQGIIQTTGKGATGILAQSIGGGGGNGGDGAGKITIGGMGGGLLNSVAGEGGAVSVTNYGIVLTQNAEAAGIIAQSIGGGGGNGGDASTGGSTFTLGGFGGAAGNGGKVSVTNLNAIQTQGDTSSGIMAQSIGGGGGNGGNASSSSVVGVGGWGTSAGNGGDVQVINGVTGNATPATILTVGNQSNAIFAQSIGGGGGNGGAGGGKLGIGGSSTSLLPGAITGNGGTVAVNNYSALVTQGDDSDGIMAQSIGGGGGSSGGTAGSGIVAIGGVGGIGGNGGLVSINNQNLISTHGSGSLGVFAQSIGGGGGAGGDASASSKIGLGGWGSAAGGGGDVVVLNGTFGNQLAASVTTVGDMATAIMAQSIGGGGGNGGKGGGLISIGGSTTGLITDALTNKVTGNGGSVSVSNYAQLATQGNEADGVFAQSIGGGGGNAGDASEKAVLAVGGIGGAGGNGGAVTVSNQGVIQTVGAASRGIFAQSIGGGGGNGGGTNYDGIAVGGSGGAAGNGDAVTVLNGTEGSDQLSAAILTKGDNADAIFAQSIGGGGGNGGTAGLNAVSIGVFANGAGGGTGGAVSINNAAYLQTEGTYAAGAVAQSVGGGGGSATGGLGIVQSILGIFNKGKQLIALASGSNGGAGDGGVVTFTNSGQVVTKGMASTGLLAQSIGGGGGLATGGDTVSIGGTGTGNAQSSNGQTVTVTSLESGYIQTTGNEAVGIIAQSVGGGGGISLNSDGDVSFDITQANGSAGDVTVTNAATIQTSGTGATAVIAQSVGGGGALVVSAGQNVNISTTGSNNTGDGGAVTLTNTARQIITTGAAANGLVAQSVAGGGGLVAQASGQLTGLTLGGNGTAGAVHISQSGDIATTGAGSYAIWAQSVGKTNGAISINIDASSHIIGGTGTGAAIGMMDGAANTLVNAGFITGKGQVEAIVLDSAGHLSSTGGWIDGTAIQGSGTQIRDTVENTGTIIGSINLGNAALTNHVEGRLITGDTVHLGTGADDVLTNAGYFSPGGVGQITTTNLTGSFVQLATGTYVADVELDPVTDKLNVSGKATLAGTLKLNITDPGDIRPGTRGDVIVSAQEGTTNKGLVIDALPSAVTSYGLAGNGADLVLARDVTFTPKGTDAVAGSLANMLGVIPVTNSAGLTHLYSALYYQPDVKALNAMYHALNDEAQSDYQQAIIDNNDLFMSTVLQQTASWRTGVQAGRVVLGDCAAQGVNTAKKDKKYVQVCNNTENWHAWLNSYGGNTTYDGNTHTGTAQFNTYGYGMAAGLDYQVNPNMLIGLAGGWDRSNVSAAERAAYGQLNSGHAALYGALKQKNFYENMVLSYTHTHVNSKRSVYIPGTMASSVVIPSIQERFASAYAINSASGKIEGGYTLHRGASSISPFVALQFSSLNMNGSYERAQTATAITGLVHHDRTIWSFPLSAGVQMDTKQSLGGHVSLNPFVRLAWQHEFLPERYTTSALQLAPEYSFTTHGTESWHNSGRVETGLNLFSLDGWSLYGKFTGVFSDVSRGIAGTGGFHLEW